MRWPDVRDAHPDQWLVVEVLDARPQDNVRIIERVSVIDV
jgi:hypothetical protein